MKKYRSYGRIILPLLIILLLVACEEDCSENPCGPDCPGPCPDLCDDPCANPEACPGQCTASNGTLSRGALLGDIRQEGEQYKVDGELEIRLSEDQTVVFTNADLTLEFDNDEQLISASGTLQIPSPTNYVAFEDVVQADIGFFTGKYLNENRNFSVTLMDESSYFVYNIRTALEMRVGANDNPDDHKPLVLKPPVGGHVTYITDYTDPFMYFSGGLDIQGSMCFAISEQGNIPFSPLQPVDRGETFDGDQLRCGSYSFFKIMEMKGITVKRSGFSAELVGDNPFDTELSAEYYAGFNGSLEMSVPVATFISFSIPLGEASAAITASGGSDGDFEALGFVNGLAEPENSWWPDIIPIKPAAQLRGSGFVHENGIFEMALAGNFSLETQISKKGIEGEAKVNNDEFTLEGRLDQGDTYWSARAGFRTEQTTFAAVPSDDLLEGLDDSIMVNIDSTISEVEKALTDLEKATQDYEFEVSLRGLRESIPVIVDKARDLTDEAVASGISSGRSQANKILKEKNRALCGDNISSQVKKVAAPYYKILDELEAALALDDNEAARVRLEKALRDLAARKRISQTITVTITAGNKKTLFVSACTFKDNFKRNVSINKQILTGAQEELILKAADNIQYIPEASDIKIEAEKIVEKLPSKDDLTKLKEHIEQGVKQIPSVGEVGFVNNHSSNTFSYYIMINGEKKEVEAFEFDSSALIDLITKDMIGEL